MKRVLFSVIATVVGLVALLGFKSHPVNNTATTISRPQTPTGSHSTGGKSKSPTPTASKKSATSAKPATSRTVDGDAVQTQYGIVQVKVTLQGKKIDQVSFDQLQSFDRHSEEINQYAAPLLVQETLNAQSANVDTISGATYTSEGYLQSLQSALDKAGA